MLGYGTYYSLRTPLPVLVVAYGSWTSFCAVAFMSKKN
jgi:hypothetical protein